MSTLGLDPSTKGTGYGFINDAGELIDSGVIEPPSSYKTNQEKISYVYDRITNILDKHNPTMVVCEDQFMGLNKKTLKTLSQLRGIIMLACEQHNKEIYYYWPTTIKLQAAGKGNASKEDVIAAIKDIYSIDATSDQADAIAVALTHIKKLQGRVEQPNKKNKKRNESNE